MVPMTKSVYIVGGSKAAAGNDGAALLCPLEPNRVDPPDDVCNVYAKRQQQKSILLLRWYPIL